MSGSRDEDEFSQTSETSPCTSWPAAATTARILTPAQSVRRSSASYSDDIESYDMEFLVNVTGVDTNLRTTGIIRYFFKICITTHTPVKQLIKP